jgi:DNA-binding GntR family transcriptional regulator
MHQSVAGRIAAALAERIVSGVLSPGSRLMQDPVAEEFQASHVPVREAFRKLEGQGLVINKPRCGVRVSQLDPGMVLEVTEMRAALEGLALHHALPRLCSSTVPLSVPITFEYGIWRRAAKGSAWTTAGTTSS